MDTSFGHWLRARRRALDLTQDDLARRAGCAVITIQKLEASERRPSRLLAEQLADSLLVEANQRAGIISLARAEPYQDLTLDLTAAAVAPLPATTLPTPLTRLIGRKQESAAVRNLLMRGDVRILTLIGPPGIGKTRLSIEVASALQAAFNDGAHFIALAPLSDQSLVMATIAQTLDVKEIAGQTLLDRLKSALHTRRMLLVLDNFEHLLDAAPLVVELLEACPALKTLITSRAALHVRGERLYLVPSLRLPDLTQRPASGTLARTPAVALFVERAQAVLPHFRLTAQNAAAVAAVCVRLDGLPLAIELAATRIKLLPPEDLLARLEQRLAVLTEGARDLPLRHRTLRAAIAWSYELLDTGEQRLFRGLGVFVGSCTLAGAEAVLAVAHLDDDDLAASIPASAVLDGLTSLIDKSLLKQEKDIGGEPRLIMLETIREFALEQLEINGETEALRRRHAEYFLALAEEAEPHLYGPDHMAWSDRLEAEHDNLRAALAWSHTVQDNEAIGPRLASAMSWFWVVHSHFSEGHMWLNAVLDRSNIIAPAARAKVLRAAAMLSENHGDFARSSAYLEESLALYRDLDDSAGAAQALIFLGRIRAWQGEYAQARSLATESLALSQAQQNTWMMIWGLMTLGDIAFLNAELQQAQQCFQQTLAYCSDLGHLYARAWAVANLGRVAHSLGDDNQAQNYYAESLASFRQLGHRRDIAEVYLAWGRLERSQGHITQAQLYYAESLAPFGESMDRRGIPECLEEIAALAGASGQPVRAARLFGAAEALREVVDVVRAPVYQTAYERDLEIARAQLDQGAWATAWTEGRACLPNQAITEAEQTLLEVVSMIANGKPGLSPRSSPSA